MEAVSQSLKHGWVWLLAILIFFFNTFLLPEGLTVVLLLTPVWCYLLYQQNKISDSVMLLIPLLVYGVIHILGGVVLSYYFISLAMICALVFFIMAFYSFVNNPEVQWDFVFRDIAIINFFFAVASIPMLYIPVLKPMVWYLAPVSRGIVALPRLKLFTSEASHYSFLLAPIAIYFYSRVLFFKTRSAFFTLFIITLPLILSFSLGVLIALLVTGLLIVCIYFRRIFSVPGNRVIFFSVIGLLGILTILCVIFPGNPLLVRIHNIINGDDTSFRGRTYEAFILAHKIIADKSFWWGIGPGQLKVVGRSIIIQYYTYTNAPAVVRIPNACAETIVYFGYIGFAIRTITELFLFFKTRVFANPFRMWLFLFVFIYQFTGSYITNVSEYLIWIFAFSAILPEYKADNSRHLLKPATL